MSLAKDLINISDSGTLQLQNKLIELQKKGKNIIQLNIGELDFLPPDSIFQGVKIALMQADTKYTPVAGKLELRKQIATHFNYQSKFKVTEQNVIIGNGAKQVIFNALRSILNPGEKVLIPTPFWVSYPEMIHLLQGQPVFLESSMQNGWKFSLEALGQKLKNSIRVIILNFPHNPTGVVPYREWYQKCAEVIFNSKGSSNIWVLSDEIYSELVFRPFEHIRFIDVAEGFENQVITINGLSKSAAITGWRMGWAVAAPHLITAMAKIQSHTTSGVCNLTQAAAIEFFKGDWNNRVFIEALEKRKQIVLETLKKINNIKWYEPQAGFYFFIHVGSKLPDFLDMLLNKYEVAVAPGEMFGLPHYFRLSFSVADTILKEGMQRLEKCLKEFF